MEKCCEISMGIKYARNIIYIITHRKRCIPLTYFIAVVIIAINRVLTEWLHLKIPLSFP